jgi:hypothetical protein
VILKIVIVINMGCKSCGNGYTGNCSCIDPITLVSTGPVGPTGPAGQNGSNGKALLASIVTVYPVTMIGTGSTEKIYTCVVDNTPTPQLVTNGDYLSIKGRLRFYTTSVFRSFWFDIVVDGVNVLTGYCTYPQANSPYYADFEIELKRVSLVGTVSIGAYKADIKTGSGTFLTQSVYSTIGTTSNAFHWTADMNIDVSVTRYDFTSGVFVLENFVAATDARLEDFIVEKHLL